MKSTATPNDEYGWINSITNEATTKFHGNHDDGDVAIYAMKQQIISHIQLNYTPNSEVERLKESFMSVFLAQFFREQTDILRQARKNVREQLSNKENK